MEFLSPEVSRQGIASESHGVWSERLAHFTPEELCCA
jgi:hypothetical protein